MLIEEITRAIHQMTITEPRGNPRATDVIDGRVRGRVADLLARHGVARVVLVL
jgi:hypothetical protein